MKNLLIILLFLPLFMKAQDNKVLLTHPSLNVGDIYTLSIIDFKAIDCKGLQILSKNEKDTLEKIFILLNNNSQIKIEIGCHTDYRGTDEFNNVLSQERAEILVSYFVEKGVSIDRLIAKGYGESKPILSEYEINEITEAEKREQAHMKNIRAEIKILNIN